MLGACSLLIAWFVYLAGWVWRLLARRPRRLGPIDRYWVNSIALIRLDEMGDFVLFSSILRPLRQAFPNARITLVLCDWICPLAELCPYVDEVIPFPTSGPKWRQFLLGPFRALRIALKFGRRFDLVINPRFARDIRGAAFLAHFSLAPWVLGYPSSTEPFKLQANRGYDRFYTHLLPAPPEVMHEVERSRSILDFLGIPHFDAKPEVWISAEDRRHADRLLRHDGWHPGDTLICLGIGASYPRKRWPMEFFGQFATRFLVGNDARFLIVGGKPDRQAGELLRPHWDSRLINLCRAGLLPGYLPPPRRVLLSVAAEMTAVPNTWPPRWESRWSRSTAIRKMATRRISRRRNASARSSNRASSWPPPPPWPHAANPPHSPAEPPHRPNLRRRRSANREHGAQACNTDFGLFRVVGLWPAGTTVRE